MPRVYLRKPRLNARGRFFAFVVLVGLALIPINKAYDSALPVVSSAAEKCVLSAVNDAITKCAGDCGAESYALIERDSAGGITGVTLDTKAVNSFKNEFSDRLTEELARCAVRIPVRLGDVIGAPASSGRGPSIVVRVTGYNAAVTDVVSEITSAGVNQALYRVTMTVRVTGTYILPRRETREVVCEAKIPVAETLIIGGVPDYFSGY